MLTQSDLDVIEHLLGLPTDAHEVDPLGRVSPELALVDAQLAVRAQLALPDPPDCFASRPSMPLLHLTAASEPAPRKQPTERVPRPIPPIPASVEFPLRTREFGSVVARSPAVDTWDARPSALSQMVVASILVAAPFVGPIVLELAQR